MASPGGERELWTSDGTPETTARFPLAPGTTGVVGHLTVYNNTLVSHDRVSSDGGETGYLWTTNGTPAGTEKVKAVPAPPLPRRQP